MGVAWRKGFKELGFALTYNGLDIQQGIDDYRADILNGKGVKKYGLVQPRFDLRVGGLKVSGKKLLAIKLEALKHVFGNSISNYQDLWRVGGAIDQQARRAAVAERASAVKHFRDSLAIRNGQAAHYGTPDAGHQAMIDEMAHCIQRIEAM